MLLANPVTSGCYVEVVVSGGGVAFVVGSIMLMDVDAPGFDVSPMLIGSVATVSAGLFLVVMMMLLRARKRAVVTGREELLKSRAEVIEWKGDRGRVRVHGEIWSARGGDEFEPGHKVRITAIDGLTVVVASNNKETLS